MTEQDLGEQWASWLREQMDTHRVVRTNAQLSRAGGVKDNGRPRIDPSTITQWLRGRRPSWQLAIAAAEAFGLPGSAGLAAAGYGDGQTSMSELRRLASSAAAPEPSPVGAGVDPELLAEFADLNPAEVQRVIAFVQGIKAR